MNRVSWIAVALALAACTHARSGTELESRKGESVKVYARGGRWYQALLVDGPDGPRFVPFDGSAALGPAEVDHVTVLSRPRGAVDGAAILGAFGAVVGAGVMAVTYDDEENRSIVVHGPGSAAVAGGVVFGLIGALVGLPVGAVFGATYRYEVAAPR